MQLGPVNVCARAHPVPNSLHFLHDTILDFGSIFRNSNRREVLAVGIILIETPLQHGDVDLGHSDAVPCLKFLKCGNSACTSLGPAASFTGPRAWSCKLPNKPLQPQTLKHIPANGRSSDTIRSLRINMRRLINVSDDVPSKTIATKSHHANTPNNIPTSHTKTIIQNSREGSHETRRELFYLFPRRELLYVCGK